MNKNSPYINKDFSYHFKEYETIGDFNRDVIDEMKNNNESLSTEVSLSIENSFKNDWEVEVSYVDNPVVLYMPKDSSISDRDPPKYKRIFTYFILNKKTGNVFKTFTRKEYGINGDQRNTRFVSGLYSLKFIDDGKFGEIEAKYGGTDGRVEKISLSN